MIFGWHDGKHAANPKTCGFGFDYAAMIFRARVLEQVDRRRNDGEVRVKAIGEV